MKYFSAVSLTWMLILSFSLPAYAETVIEIVVTGNNKTRAEVIKQELPVRVGEEFDIEQLEEARQAVMDLRLFKWVTIVREKEDEGIRLVINVKEKKHDWYILPRIDRNADGDITLGINWKANNLLGLNQTSRMVIAHKKYQEATQDEEYRLKWNFTYPRIINTQLSAYTYVNVSQTSLDEEREEGKGSYDRQEYTVGAGVGRWFSKIRASQGLHGSLGLEYQEFTHEHTKGVGGFYDDLTEIALIGNLSYRSVHDFLYSRDGYHTGLILKNASEELGSDRPYFHQYAYYRRYMPIPAMREHTNFNFQVQMASGDEAIFDEPIYELSGGHTLRGYKRETLEGDSYFLVNTQFLTPIFGKKNLRAGGLFDFGNAYDSFSEIKELDFEYGAGLSLRWRLKQWVDTDIRLDWAYGFGDEGGSRFYVSSNMMF